MYAMRCSWPQHPLCLYILTKYLLRHQTILPGQLANQKTVTSSIMTILFSSTDTGFLSSSSASPVYVQVDLGSIHDIRALDIQGIYPIHYTKTFRLYYSIDGNVWETYNDLQSDDIFGEVLQANTDSNSIVRVDLKSGLKVSSLSSDVTMCSIRYMLWLRYIGTVVVL